MSGRFLCLILLSTLLVSCASSGKKIEGPKRPIAFGLTDGIKNPESVYYHAATQSLYISNMVGENTKKDSEGHINQVTVYGTEVATPWINGLNAPKGMRAYKNLLWVTDIDRVFAFDLNSARPIHEINIPEAKFLNDVAIDRKGVVYVSDTLTSTIYQIKDGKEATVFMQGPELESPNGLLVVKDELYVAAWGHTTDWSTQVPGKLYRINLETKKITPVTEAIGNLDGLERDRQGRFYVSDWVAGKIYQVTADGKATVIHTMEQGCADFAIVPEQNLLIIPEMVKDRVIGIKL